MPNYYNKTNPSDLRDLPQSLIDTWVEVNNPKLQEWILAPAKPSPDAVWDSGQWIIPPPPTYTAEQWLTKEGYGATQLVTLLDLYAALSAAGKASVKLNAVKSWTNTVLGEYVQNAQPKENWGTAPFTFNETVIEAYQELGITLS
jgi:hypothetical protein